MTCAGHPGDGRARHSNAPTLETERLRLRAFRVEDLDSLAAIWAEERVVRYLGGQPLSREDAWRRTLAATGQWPHLGFGYWIAELKSAASVVGLVGFADFKRDMDPSIEGEPEFGYVLAPTVHGQGIAGEACRAVLQWADRTIGAESYPAIIDLENTPSIKLAVRLGFERQSDAVYKGQPIALFRRGKS